MSDKLTAVEQNIQHVTGQLERRLFVIAGPSGVGKNTIIKKLLANHPVEFDRVRTYTTRAPREDEIEGEQYHFVSEEEFVRLARSNRLMEATPENVEGHDVYGLGKAYSMPADIFDEIEGAHIVLAEVDVVGAQRLRERYPECVTIFVTAPPLALLQRIGERKDDKMDAESLVQRMETARSQIRAAKEFDYVVYNRDERLAETVAAVEGIIQAERMRVRDGFDLEAEVPDSAFEAIKKDITINGMNGA